jgi:hypothetical protein
MALIRSTTYPGLFSPPTAGQPQGAFKNRTTPTSADGSYLEQQWANDWSGFFSALLDSAGITPDGSVDEVGASQYFDSLIQVIANSKAAYPSGYISGGVPSNAADADHDVTISPVSCRDSTDTLNIDLLSSITKRLDATFAAGDNNGGRFSGVALSPNTTYHVFSINNGSSVDVGFDTSITAANKPAGYDSFRRICSIVTDSGSNIRRFNAKESACGLYISYLSRITDYASTSPGTTRQNVPLSVPIGLSVDVRLNVFLGSNGDTGTYISETTWDDISPSVGNADISSWTAAQERSHIEINRNTDVSGQITRRSSANNGSYLSPGLAIRTLGYTDSRSN